MAVIEKRPTKDGKTQYRVNIRLKRYPPQTSTHDTLRDAKRWAQSIEFSICEGRHFKTAEAKKHTFGEMVDRSLGMSCLRSQKVKTSNPHSFFGGKNILAVTH